MSLKTREKHGHDRVVNNISLAITGSHAAPHREPSCIAVNSERRQIGHEDSAEREEGGVLVWLMEEIWLTLSFS